MRVAFALVGAFVLFAAFFALHIVAGATDQGWLFVIAVALIYLSAWSFPAIAWLLAGNHLSRRDERVLLIVGGIVGLALTNGALWAANGRAFAWWQWPVSVVLVAGTSGLVLALARRRGPRAERPRRLSSQA